jgi:hypothetical protein
MKHERQILIKENEVDNYSVAGCVPYSCCRIREKWVVVHGVQTIVPSIDIHVPVTGKRYNIFE